MTDVLESEYELVLNNSDLDVKIFKSTEEAGIRTLHWHRHIEIVLVLTGSVTFQYESQTTVLIPGDFIAIGSGILHSSSHLKNSAIVLQVPVAYIARYWDNPENVLFTIHNSHEDNEYNEVVTLIKQMFEVYESKLPGYRFKFNEFLLRTLFDLFTKYRQTGLLINSIHDKRLGEVISYVNKNYFQLLTVSNLAQKFHYNSDYLSRLFKKRAGISLSRYIYVVRLSHVYFEIVNSSKGIRKIFIDSGINNIRLGTKIFEEYYGSLPSEIRRRRQ
ncbi:helix-turn-helix domain-containing protein [Leuconostoc gelidum subsp. gelidum]|nr:helix-turn-helix domain-containing protein [Leuconostoc gelidum subsp. gelidum]